MGFSTGAIMFRRFFIVGQHPKRWTQSSLRSFERGAFGRFRTLSGDGLEMGWIRPTHLFDTDFSEPETVKVGRFVYLAMRVDRTAAPPAIIRSYRAMEEAARRNQTGATILTRKQKQEAREAAQARADDEAGRGAFRRIAAYPVLIDLEEGVVYFGNMGTNMADRLAALCAQSPDISLVPATARETAARIARRAGLTDALEDARPWRLVDPPNTADDFDESLDTLDASFLGREFLTYLWWLSETAEGLAPRSGGASIEFVIHRALHMECPFGLSGKTSIRTDAPTGCPESRDALAAGKLPVRMDLLLALNGEEITLTLDARRWSLSGLRLPRSQQRDPDAVLEERFLRLRDVVSAWDELFETFLLRRFGPQSARMESTIREWIDRRTGGEILSIRETRAEPRRRQAVTAQAAQVRNGRLTTRG